MNIVINCVQHGILDIDSLG